MSGIEVARTGPASWRIVAFKPVAAFIRRAMTPAERKPGLASVVGVWWSEPVVVAAAAVVGLSAVFVLLPGIDIAISDLFHRPGDGFYLARDPLLGMLRRSSTAAMGVILLFALAGTAIRLRSRGGRSLVCARHCGFLVAGLALGPGLVVNTLLKNGWGRARPVQTDMFGGAADFTPAWWMSQGCASNCSFVSGEASSAAWMVAALILLPPSWRPWATGPVVAYAAALSLNRLAFGGHYLSDILLSWAITGLVLTLLHRAVVASPRARPQPLRSMPATG